jgi:O-antigen/teichoic acid export membrane protein
MGRQSDTKMPGESETIAAERASRFGIQRVHRDAGAMALSSIANAALGAAFWAFAAKFISPQQLGVMTAVLAVIVAVGGVLASGIGDAYTALLPAAGMARQRVYRRGQRVFMVLGTAAAVIGAVATVLVLPEVKDSAGVALVVAIGIVLWAAFNLQNCTMISIGRATWVPAASLVLGVGKIVLLPVLAFMVGWHSVELAVVIAIGVIVAVLRPAIGRIIATGDGLSAVATMSEELALAEFSRVVVRTIALSALGLGVLTLTPFLVTVFAGPSQGALFALAFAIVSTIDFVAASMAVSLVVHGASAPEHAGAMARTILLRAAALTIVGTVALIALVPTALRMLNPAYGEMGALPTIVILCAATVSRVAYIVWAALQQSRRKLRMPLIFNVLAAVLLFAIMPSLCHAYGAVGGASAVLIHQVVLSVLAGVHLLISRQPRRTARHAT